MKVLFALPGILLLFLGIGYLSRPDIISAFNSWCRENLFTDRLLIIHRRKVGVMLIFVGVLILSCVLLE
ncbi:MAG: hypothetical protein GX817_06105 [Elusimicrobia bacterium]|nr:hypothetical protein [Elusimicrobiota bacterium]